ncbi:hypothetical protein ACP4OV_029764 [Aristida adscensionis]
MEAKMMKPTARGVNGKVVPVYSKYVKAQCNPAVSITQPYQMKPSAVDAASKASYTDNVDERAAAFILAVRQRLKNEQMV